eukprot:534646-Prorocentrum_minimum.AAC.3
MERLTRYLDVCMSCDSIESKNIQSIIACPAGSIASGKYYSAFPIFVNMHICLGLGFRVSNILQPPKKCAASAKPTVLWPYNNNYGPPVKSATQFRIWLHLHIPPCSQTSPAQRVAFASPFFC